MAKLVQVTDVEEALTYWKNGMLMCRGGKRKWSDYSSWNREDADEVQRTVQACLGNYAGGWILVEDAEECYSTTASVECDSTTANEVSKD